ncbi:MAG TPA: ATP-binding protein [Acetobacteraceae bacterium]|nr:ATP-binding protein [Acetobacteraceae bacterium]
MRLPLWPRSLAARTAAVLLIGLAVVQATGLTIHALDRIELQRLAQARDVAARVMSVYRNVVNVDAAQRAAVLAEMHRLPGMQVDLSQDPPISDLPDTPRPEQRLVRVNMNVIPMPGPLRPHEVHMFGGPYWGRMIVGLHLPEGDWLNVTVRVDPPRPWHSPTFLWAFVLMTAAAALLTLWAVRRMTAPVATLAKAAEALGRDVNAPPLPEDGPSEVATAAAAFNTMAARIRRFVQDRTEMLTAIGHDLRTPITRLKLRAEFMEDDEQRRKMLIDLEELEAMVSATLAFGRDAKSTEPVSPLDLPELLRTILDEATDAWPEVTEKVAYEGPSHLTVRARPLSLKRALANLVANAVNYGGSARMRLTLPANGTLVIEVEDDGPGIAPQELDRVFEPFHRGEPSRNRETGGVGLGLPIARNIFRAHGGDVTLANRPTGGLRATVTLPA